MNCEVSYTNDDIVVSPPQKPVARNNRASGERSSVPVAIWIIIPMMRQPMTFDRKVPAGNENEYFRKNKVQRYLVTAPISPPAPTYRENRITCFIIQLIYLLTPENARDYNASGLTHYSVAPALLHPCPHIFSELVCLCPGQRIGRLNPGLHLLCRRTLASSCTTALPGSSAWTPCTVAGN